MALVVVASAKGAPGVTTTTVALAALTPGAIVADLDPDGGDIALRYRREDGSPLDPEVGLLSLAASLRRDHSEVVSQTESVDQHLQVTAGGLDVLLGVSGPEQAVGLGPLWSPLARALAGTGRTVFADCGRLGPASPAMPVLMQADAVLLLARAELEELSHLRERLRFLTGTLPGRYAGPARIGVVLVADERDRAAGPRTEQLLRASGLAVPVLGTIANDPRGAGRLRGLHGGRAGRTTLVRSVRSLLPTVTALTGTALTVGVLTDTARTDSPLTDSPLNDSPLNGTAPEGPAGKGSALKETPLNGTRSRRRGAQTVAADEIPLAPRLLDPEAAVPAPEPIPKPIPEPMLDSMLEPIAEPATGPETDAWLGTRAASSVPRAEVAPSPYRPTWEPGTDPQSSEPGGPERVDGPAAGLGVASSTVDGPAPASDPTSPTEDQPQQTDQTRQPEQPEQTQQPDQSEQTQVSEQPEQTEQSGGTPPSQGTPARAGSSPTGWPRPGRGSGTLTGVAATVLQNWGR